MCAKVIDFTSPTDSQKNSDNKYSELLLDLVKPFEYEFPDDLDFVEIISFSVHAWNSGCIALTLSEEQFGQLFENHDMSEFQRDLWQRMVDLKKNKFAQYDRVIIDFEIKGKSPNTILRVATADFQQYMENMDAELSNLAPADADFEEGYVDRSALILKHKQAFYDWMNKLGIGGDIHDLKEANIYLFHETSSKFGPWLKKNFDQFFKIELEEWCMDQKKWPQKRTYKMFNEWFDVELSTMIYDLESEPVNKD
jgi:hypothetical protein